MVKSKKNKVKRTKRVRSQKKIQRVKRTKRVQRTKRVKRTSKRKRRSFLKNKRKTQKRKRVLRGGMDAQVAPTGVADYSADPSINLEDYREPIKGERDTYRGNIIVEIEGKWKTANLIGFSKTYMRGPSSNTVQFYTVEGGMITYGREENIKLKKYDGKDTDSTKKEWKIMKPKEIKADKVPDRLGPDKPLPVRIANLEEILRYKRTTKRSLESIAVDPSGSDGTDQTGHGEWGELQDLKTAIDNDEDELQRLKDLELLQWETLEDTLTATATGPTLETGSRDFSPELRRLTAERDQGRVGIDPTLPRKMGDYSGNPYEELSTKQKALANLMKQQSLLKGARVANND